mmetsp:Transcript_28522/g.71810  ORF Transcript_28522/g.71810 Transcript_28522/m.71810 type:complete len:114 (+) Transcript_28522:1-342(+)
MVQARQAKKPMHKEMHRAVRRIAKHEARLACLESSPDCYTKIQVEAELVLYVDDAAKREVFGLQGGIGGVHAHTGFGSPSRRWRAWPSPPYARASAAARCPRARPLPTRPRAP